MIWPVEARKYPDDHPIHRRPDARVLSFTGDQTFLDSLQRFPKDYPFNIRIANVYICSGERTSEGQKVLRRRCPRMTEDSPKNLLHRYGKEIVEDAEKEDDKRGDGGAGRSGSYADHRNKPYLISYLANLVMFSSIYKILPLMYTILLLLFSNVKAVYNETCPKTRRNPLPEKKKKKPIFYLEPEKKKKKMNTYPVPEKKKKNPRTYHEHRRRNLKTKKKNNKKSNLVNTYHKSCTKNYSLALLNNEILTYIQMRNYLLTRKAN